MEGVDRINDIIEYQFLRGEAKHIIIRYYDNSNEIHLYQFLRGEVKPDLDAEKMWDYFSINSLEER